MNTYCPRTSAFSVFVHSSCSRVSPYTLNMIVSVAQGLLEGREDKSLTTNKTFYSFLNIPYAEPPVGELRFRPPVPPAKWQGVRNAKCEGNHCFQLIKDHHQANESEDCLYLNVFTPEPPNAEARLKPVIVYLHGGGYYFCDGSMETASPDNLINYDVIIVTLNYRLHIFGFLNLNTPSCVGNCGSKDHVQALRWIQENIKSFGGDPNNVTVYGDSSGGNAAHLLTVSPLAKGLFHKAIASSGSIISSWTRDNQVEEGFEIGRRLGFTGTDPEELVAFLRAQPALTLAAEAKKMIYGHKKDAPFQMSATMIFVPSIEKYEQDSFLPDHPGNLISKSEPVPLLAGVSEKEGITVLFGLDNYKEILDHLRNNLIDLIEPNVPCDPAELPELVKEVQDYYLGSLDDGLSEAEGFEKIVEIYSHLYYKYLYNTIEKTIKGSAPSYIFMFSFVGQLNESVHWNMPISGALHADNSEYTMPSRCFHPNGIQLEETSRKVMDRLCTAYTNFARTSDPNPLPKDCVLWKPYTPDDPSYMLFDRNCLSVEGRIWDEGLKFWKRMFCKYVKPKWHI